MSPKKLTEFRGAKPYSPETVFGPFQRFVQPRRKARFCNFLRVEGGGPKSAVSLAHQNRTIAIASDFRVDGAKSPEIPQKEGVLGSEIAARNRKSLATFHRSLQSQCSIAFSCLGNRAISGGRNGHRNRKNRCDFGALRPLALFVRECLP